MWVLGVFGAYQSVSELPKQLINTYEVDASLPGRACHQRPGLAGSLLGVNDFVQLQSLREKTPEATGLC